MKQKKKFLFIVTENLFFIKNIDFSIKLDDDRQNSYARAIEQALNNDVQMLVIVVPNNNADRYVLFYKINDAFG